MKKYDVAAYVWPAYTGDEGRSLIFWPEGYGEWETVRTAKARFEGHKWPRKPLWGYCNEADPYVMEMQIEAAVDHGVNAVYKLEHADFQKDYDETAEETDEDITVDYSSEPDKLYCCITPCIQRMTSFPTVNSVHLTST